MVRGELRQAVAAFSGRRRVFTGVPWPSPPSRMHYRRQSVIARIRETLMTPAGQTGTRSQAALISARLDRLPTTRYIWKLLLLISLGGCFEFYDLFVTAYIGPGLVRSGLFLPPRPRSSRSMD